MSCDCTDCPTCNDVPPSEISVAIGEVCPYGCPYDLSQEPCNGLVGTCVVTPEPSNVAQTPPLRPPETPEEERLFAEIDRLEKEWNDDVKHRELYMGEDDKPPFGQRILTRLKRLVKGLH